MKQLDFSVREKIIENCRQAEELADALSLDGGRHDFVRKLARSIKERMKAIEGLTKTVLAAGISMICHCLRLPAAGRQYAKRG